MRLNPLFVKEIRTLFRGKGFPVVLFSYLGIVTLILIGGAVLALGKYYTTMTWEMGRKVVLGLGIYQLFALSVIAPSLTAASLSLERDRDTFDVLMVMPLGLARIVFYKTLASLMFLVMLVMASLPLLAGGFVLGGVAPSEVAVVALLTLMAILATGALGLMFSSFFRRTIIAVPGACLLAGVLIVATAFWILVYGSTLSLRYANPVIALLNHMDGARLGFFGIEVPVWVPCTVFLGLLFLLFLVIATEGFRFKFRRDYAIAGALSLLLCVAVQTFSLGEALHAMPDKLDQPTVFGLAAQLIFMALLVAIADPVMPAPALPGISGAPDRSRLSVLFRPGTGLTLSALACLTALWMGVAAAYSSMRGDTALLIGPPMLAAAIALFFTALCRAIARLRPWKRRAWVRVLAGCMLLAALGLPQAVAMILHAGDNQATKQVLDVVLFANPLLACRGLGVPPSSAGEVLAPYPYLSELLHGVPFFWITSVFYGMLALALGLLARVLRRRTARTRVARS